MKSNSLAQFDAHLQGLRKDGSYLITGKPAQQKTALCLRFLQQTLEAGEGAVLVTSSPPPEVIAQARQYNCDLNGYLTERKLLIFEYPENIAEAVASDKDHDVMIEEFRSLLSSQKPRRVAFDPVTPLAAFAGRFSVRRFTAVVETCTQLEVCAALVLDAQIDEAVKRQAAALVQGEMCVDPPSVDVEAEEEAEWIPVERPGPRLAAADHRMPVPQIAATPETMEAKAGPRILIIEPDATRRLTLRSQLERNFSVIEASGLNDGLTLASVGKPDAVLLATEIPGASGLEAARMLRERGFNALILGIGEYARPASDQIAALAAGIDVCYAEDTDPRLLRLSLLNLLQRVGAVAHGQAKTEAERIVRRPEPDGYPCTTDFHQFNGRLARETLYARENGLPFVIVTFHLPDVPLAVEELATLVSAHVRLPNLVYIGPSGVACLLAEAQSARPFLNRLWTDWQGGYAPVVEELRFLNQDAFLQRARDFVASRAGIHGERKPPVIAASVNRRLVARRIGQEESAESFPWEGEAKRR
jgi:CheY-like chemotaxis protein